MVGWLQRGVTIAECSKFTLSEENEMGPRVEAREISCPNATSDVGKLVVA